MARNFSSKRRRRRAGEPHVPLDAVEQRRPRQVGGADVRGVEAGVAAEHPRLGVEPGAVGVVLDLDLGAELADEPVEGPPLGRPHVGRRDDAQRGAALPQPRSSGSRSRSPCHFTKAQQQVHLVAGVDLGPQLGAEVRLAVGVGEQRCLGQWGAGARHRKRPNSECARSIDATQLTHRVTHDCFLLRQALQHRIDHGDPPAGVRGRRQCPPGRVVHVLRQHMRLMRWVERLHAGGVTNCLQRSLELDAQQRLVQAVGKGFATHRAQLLAVLD